MELKITTIWFKIHSVTSLNDLVREPLEALIHCADAFVTSKDYCPPPNRREVDQRIPASVRSATGLLRSCNYGSSQNSLMSLHSISDRSERTVALSYRKS